jgi:methionyl-tRNA formyltransferase
MRVILLGNWGIGLEILKVLHRMPNIEISTIVTRYKDRSPDKWHNVVYNYAYQCGYKIIVEDDNLLGVLQEEVVEANVDLLISHAFMKILPKQIFLAPTYGSINIHASLLPKYRGPSPTYWVLKNREKITGLTCHYIDEGIDTGDIIHKIEVVVNSDDNLESVINKQKAIVADLITESLLRIKDEHFRAVPQVSKLATYAPRPQEQLC